MPLDSVDEILDFAIRKEEEAARFYRDLAERVKTKRMADMLRRFAREEDGHRAKLIQVKEGKRLLPKKKVPDLRISDYLADKEVGGEQLRPEDLDYQEVLLLAMSREKAAFRLYTDLAAATEDPEIRETLLSLALEEARHKLHFELEYDEHILTEN